MRESREACFCFPCGVSAYSSRHRYVLIQAPSIWGNDVRQSFASHSESATRFQFSVNSVTDIFGGPFAVLNVAAEEFPLVVRQLLTLGSTQKRFQVPRMRSILRAVWFWVPDTLFDKASSIPRLNVDEALVLRLSSNLGFPRSGLRQKSRLCLPKGFLAKATTQKLNVARALGSWQTISRDFPRCRSWLTRLER